MSENELINELYKKMLEYDTIYNELSKVDLEVSDIYHYIEFNDLDVQRGFKIYKKLQDTLRRRREIKNKIEVAKNLRKFGINKKNLKNACEYLATEHDKQYTPRVLNELFE